jgi:glycerol-3-phosphate acyltransferase PlsY
MIETLALVPWEGVWPHLLGVSILAYLIGSIPFGLIFAWMAGAGDVRKIGSGNIGATNVLRTGNRMAAAATLLCDAGKGYVAVRLAGDYGGQVFAAFAGLFVFLGHVYPVWLKFKGGKGVATFIGVTAGIGPLVAVATCLTWLTAAWTTRYSSLAALLAAAATPFYFLFPTIYATLWAALTGILALFIVFTHRSNIARVIKGEEPRIGRR